MVPHPTQTLGLDEAGSGLPRVAKQINTIDIYKQAAAAAKVRVSKDVMRTSKLMDGAVWDGKNPVQYAGSFKIRVA